MRKAIWAAFLLTTLTVTLIPASAQSSSAFVAMYGIVDKWGLEPAYGRVCAFAEVPDKWAEVGLFWYPGIVTILSLPANYTFYAARLNVTYEARLDYLGYKFYVSGLWNAYKITIEYDGSGNCKRKQIVPIVKNGPGNLTVLAVENFWTTFTVRIQGIESIAGVVRCFRIWTPQPPYEIIKGDLNLDGKVDILDLVHVARRRGTQPGLGIKLDRFQFEDFDFNSDLNSDDTVDIDDLIIVAKDFGRTYG